MMSEKLDRPMTLAEKMSLRFHLMMCRGCNNYDQQMQLIHKACRHVSGQADKN